MIVLAALACALLPRAARADVQRFAVLIGNNDGDGGDAPLRYAQSDAARVYEALRDLGGFAPANMVLLAGEDARTVEDTVIAVNERVRLSLTQPGSQALLLLYYSGHADVDAFHLGRSRLLVRRLSQLVRGSAATFRLMVLDACRSGVLTRAKGGAIVRAPPLATDESLLGSGLAVLAASAANEDAQESEQIRGSFFTHAFVSGLLGAADVDGDGAVSLAEAYQYAYGATVRATSRTLLGMQHPTFRFEFGGQGAVVLTRPEAFAAARAALAFPPDVAFLVLRDGPDGAVVGEVGAYDRRRALSVRPGRYFVRGRGSDVLYERELDLAPGTTTRVELAAMRRSEYARLVRKGGRSPGLAHAVQAGPWLRTALSNADGPCIGAFAGYGVELEQLGIRARAGACTSRFESDRVDAVTNEYDLELRATRSWDLAALSFDVGLGAGAALFTQRFETEGRAAPRNSLGPYLLIGLGTGLDLGCGYGLRLGTSAETHFLRVDSATRAHDPVEFALRLDAAMVAEF